MINLSKSGDTIVFSFINNGHYLENGTIEVPVNSLSLVTDSSNMATFYKADSNDIFISATYDELGKTKAEMLEWFEENMVGGGSIDSGAVQTQIDQSISGFADSVLYNSTSKYVEFYNGGTGGTKVYEFDASDFVIDGMVDDVRIETISGVSYLVIDFNTASGKEDIQIPLTDIFDPSNYYTKAEVDGIVSGKADSSAVTQEISAAVSGKVDTSTYTAYTAATEAVLSGKTSVINLTQAQYEDLVTGGTVDPTVLYNITDATPIDMSQYWTSAETNSAITQAVSGKQDTLSAGTGIEISGNVISATGGGSITIDPSLDSGSTNAVANSAITEAFNGTTYGSPSTLNNSYVGSRTAYAIIYDVPNVAHTWYMRCFDSSVPTFTTIGIKDNDNFYNGNGEIMTDIPDWIDQELSYYDSTTRKRYVFLKNGVYADYFANVSEYTFTIFETNNTGLIGSLLSKHSIDTDAHTTSAEKSVWNAKLDSSAITTSISSSSTDAQVPSAKAVYDTIGNINSVLNNI